MNEIIGFIYNSPVSSWIRIASWVIPTVQSVHILALALLVSSALLLDLRLAGIYLLRGLLP